MNLQTITLVSFGFFEKDILEKTAVAVIEVCCSVIIKDGHLDLSEYFDAPRRHIIETPC